MKYKYVYGPILSRRLRFSLGIDIIPFKNCSFNCIYCQVGRTKHLTVIRDLYTPTKEVLVEIRHALAQTEDIDYVTFSGSGEPTLHADLGVLIRGVKKMTSIPVAVLTNSSLIVQPDVQDDLQYASVIAPTLCTTNDDTFKKIHRAHKTINISSIIGGLISFRKSYAGAIWLEVMLIKGVNDSDQQINDLAKAIDRICPDKVHLNTVVRPPNEPWVKPVSENALEHARSLIGDKAEIVVPKQGIPDRPAQKDIDRRILDIIQRRPVTIQDISSITGINHHEVIKHMTRLLEQGKAKITRHGNRAFYEIIAKEDV